MYIVTYTHTVIFNECVVTLFLINSRSPPLQFLGEFVLISSNKLIIPLMKLATQSHTLTLGGA